MGTTKVNGIPVPDDADGLRLGAVRMREMAAALGAGASGTATIVVTNASAGSVTVTFPAGRFTAAPHVVTSATQNSNFVASAHNVTATSVTLWVRHIASTVGTWNVPATYIARQETPS